jgi:lysophospholipase L1-like esterase
MTTNVTPKKVLCAGDSITAGNLSTGTGGYRTYLVPMLQAYMHAGVNMVGDLVNGPSWLTQQHHYGNSGWTLEQMQAAIAAEINAQHPDLIIMMIGTNSVAIESPQTAAVNYGNMIDTIFTTKPTVALILCTITGLDDSVLGAGENDSRVAFNNVLIPVWQKKKAGGKQIAIVDTYNAIDPTQDTADGEHPNDQGHARLAAAIMQGVGALGFLQISMGKSLLL